VNLPKIAISLFITLVLLAGSPPTMSAAEKFVAPAGCRMVTYSTNPQYPPYDWGSGPNRFDGASIELLRMVMSADLQLKAVT
jgi:polar amino acid transport system substrate-binding protein